MVRWSRNQGVERDEVRAEVEVEAEVKVKVEVEVVVRVEVRLLDSVGFWLWGKRARAGTRAGTRLDLSDGFGMIPLST